MHKLYVVHVKHQTYLLMSCSFSLPIQDLSASHASYRIMHSHHSQKRASQRGVSDEVIRLVIQYGRKVRKQGLQYYFGATRDFPETIDHQMVEKCNDVVVILRGTSIVTCYRNPKGLRNIRKKREWLS